MSNSAILVSSVKLLAPAAPVDVLTENIKLESARSGLSSIVCIQLGVQKCLLYEVVGYPLSRGCLN